MSKRFKFRNNKTNSEYGYGKPTQRQAKVRAKLIRELIPRTQNQRFYMQAIEDNDIIFCIGPAGSGKTHIAVGMAVRFLRDGSYEARPDRRIILVRPHIGASKTKLGFLPGDLEAKMDPYLRPIFDELKKFFTPDEIKELQRQEQIEICSLDYIRGRTFEDAIILLDEAQNATLEELKMFVTRLGRNSKMIINGDHTQTDLPHNESGAFVAYSKKYGNRVDGIASIKLEAIDIVRHPTVARLIEIGLDIE